MYKNIVKRCFDIVGSVIMLVILSPLLLVVALIIKISNISEPILFRQQRCGKDNKNFTIYKFRTMYKSAPEDMPTNDFHNANKYITKVGRVLRMTSIDELPQLINILKGDMSFIGPRPVVFQEVELIEKRANSGANSVRPGVSGLSQINGRDFITIDKKVEYDTYYAKNLSFLLDLKIFFITIPAVIIRKGIRINSPDQDQENKE